jgi:hypothetical protein
MKNSRQRDLLIATAQRHGLNLTQAEEIWNSFGHTIAKHISSDHRGENNKFVLDKFPVIHIEHFGKFIPNKKRINYANYCIDKNKTDDTQDNTTDSSVS